LYKTGKLLCCWLKLLLYKTFKYRCTKHHLRDIRVPVAASRNTIYRIAEQYEEAESVHYKGAKGHKYSIVYLLARRALVTRISKINVRLPAQHIGVSTSTAKTICRGNFPFFIFKIRCQPLLDDGIAKRYAFVRKYRALLDDSPGCLECHTLLRRSTLPPGWLHGKTPESWEIIATNTFWSVV
jgi:hypothetical protein